MGEDDLGGRLDARERDAFERDGFLLVERALSADEIASAREAADRADAAYRLSPGVGPHHVLNQHDLIAADPAWLRFLVHPRTFPVVWGVLGWNVQLFHTQLLVTPPAPPGAPAEPYGWHQDNNRMNLDLGVLPQPRVSVKVGYFLSDLPAPGMGNLAVVPRSHRRGAPPAEGQPGGAVQLLARSGDAVVFDRRLWHAASTNASDRTRVFVTFAYSHRWLRTKSALAWDPTFDRLGPVHRQLLGFTTSPNGRFEPLADDVPLRAWISETFGSDAVAP